MPDYYDSIIDEQNKGIDEEIVYLLQNPSYENYKRLNRLKTIKALLLSSDGRKALNDLAEVVKTKG